MLEGNDYKALEILFPFVALVVDRAKGTEQTRSMTQVRCMDSDLLFHLDWKF